MCKWHQQLLDYLLIRYTGLLKHLTVLINHVSIWSHFLCLELLCYSELYFLSGATDA